MKNIRDKKRILILVLSTVILIPVMLPLFSPNVYGTADGLAHKFRLMSFTRSLTEGNLRVRWLSDQALNFGSPIFLFNYLLPYYVTSIFKLSGFDIRASVQIYQGLTLVMSFIFMFLLAEKLRGKTAGIIAAVVYTYAPYHLLTIYLYEGWGEMTAFVYPPLILYLALRLKETQGKAIPFVLLTLSWFLFILSHNVSVLIYTPILLLLGATLYRFTPAPMLLYINSFISASIISSFFTLPAIFLNNLTAYPSLISKEMGMRGSYYKSLEIQLMTSLETIKTGIAKYYDFTAGLPILFLILLFPAIYLLTRRRKTPFNGKGQNTGNNKVFLLALYILFILCLFLTTLQSDFIWSKLTFLKFIVYPFRMLSPVTFLGSLLAGLLFFGRRQAAVIIVILAVIAGYPYTKAWVEIFPFGDDYFSQPQTFLLAPGTLKNMATAEFLPVNVSIPYILEVEKNYLETGKLPEKFEFLQPVKINRQETGVEKLSVEYSSPSDNTLTVNSFYFPNWKAIIDNKEAAIRNDPNGRMQIQIPAGRHLVKLYFSYSQTEKVANMITIAGLLILGGELIWLRKLKLRF